MGFECRGGRVMARGTNAWSGSGNVGGDIEYGKTRDDVDICSFELIIEDKGQRTTCVRVNVFGPGLVGICRNKLDTGRYCVVTGELMNKGDQMEVRAKQVIIT
jgi:hypothetical protein